MPPHNHRCYQLLLLGLAILIALLPVPAAARQHKATIPSPFGVVEAHLRPDDAVEADLSWDRVIFEWRYLQPDGPDDWETSQVPDAWLERAQRDQRLVVGLIKNAPRWATGSDLLGAVPRGLDLPIADPGNVWAAFITKLVRYYSTRWDIHHWLIYNEPDIRPEDTQRFEFAGTVDDYYRVLKVAYQAAHAADPKAVIHLAGLTFWEDVVHERPLYLERLLRLANADPEAKTNNLFFDVLTVHVFSGTDWVWRITQQMRSLPESFGYPKPVWINEMNVRITADSGWPVQAGDPAISLDEQASFIVQGAALALAMGVERIAVYKLYDNIVHENYEAWGLIRADGTRRPGYYALQTVSRYFSGTTRAQRFNSPQAVLVTLVQPGKTVYVIWNKTDQPLYVRVKAMDKNASDTTVISTQGQVRSIPAGEAQEGSYELLLPPCTLPCQVQGEPRILIQKGMPQAVWLVQDKALTRLN
ncbi:MAG: hypothetical protein IT324_22150 [Anaerolineae bacterium]|nr:hypothetical protein [Anaerolineae bacterium]